jgi:hypothetical protein
MRYARVDSFDRKDAIMRTPLTLLASTLALGTALATAQTAQAAPKDYTLVCNGVEATYQFHDPWLSGKPTIRVYFNRSSNAASRQKPGHGQCAWVDRPVAASEPGFFFFKNAENPVRSVKITPQGITASILGVGRIDQFRGGGRQSHVAQNLLLLDAVKKSQLFYVQVHSEKIKGRTSLIMTRFGP